MDVLVEGVGLADVAFQAVDREVHLGEPDGGGGLFLAEEGDAMGWCPCPVRSMKWLDWTNMPPEPQAGSKTTAVVGLDDVDDGLDERRRREELAVILRPLHGELHQEVLVNAPEDIAGGGAENFAVEDAQQVFEQVVLELVVVLG